MRSFVGLDYVYLIDEIGLNIKEGLIPVFECNHPCRTCLKPDRNNLDSDCASCQTNNKNEILQYLELMRCIIICPDGKFGDLKNDKICTFCPNDCLTCKDELNCLTCKRNSQLTDLLNNWCAGECTPGLCPVNFKCVPCNAPPFNKVDVLPNPSTVGRQSHLTLTASISDSITAVYSNNDIVWLRIPKPGIFILSVDPSQNWRDRIFMDYFSDISLCESLTVGISVDYCSIYYTRVMLKLNVTVQNIKTATFRIGNFQNPQTTRPIQGIQTVLTNSTDFAKSALLRTEMLTLTPDDITNAEIEPLSKVVGLPN